MYNVEFFLDLDLAGHTIDITALDRSGRIVPVEITRYHQQWKLSLSITMPNILYLICRNTCATEIRSLRIGSISVNHSALPDLIEFKPYSGEIFDHINLQDWLQGDSIKTHHWNQPGCVILSLFDQNPIRYHLNLKTII